MFSTVRAGLCILVQIHLSLFSPSCQTQRNQRSLTAPYSHAVNPGRSYPCCGTHQQGKLLFHSSPRHNLGKRTDTLNCLPVWALPCFSPCQAQWGPSFSSGEKRGWACCCDTTSWFWNTGKRWKDLTRHATRQHAATMSSCFPDALQSHAFFHEKQRIMFVMNTPLSHCRSSSN